MNYCMLTLEDVPNATCDGTRSHALNLYHSMSVYDNPKPRNLSKQIQHSDLYAVNTSRQHSNKMQNSAKIYSS